jgi:hypothetical protein
MPPEPVKQIASAPTKSATPKTKEMELPSGDIMIKDENENKSI